MDQIKTRTRTEPPPPPQTIVFLPTGHGLKCAILSAQPGPRHWLVTREHEPAAHVRNSKYDLSIWCTSWHGFCPGKGNAGYKLKGVDSMICVEVPPTPTTLLPTVLIYLSHFPMNWEFIN